MQVEERCFGVREYFEPFEEDATSSIFRCFTEISVRKMRRKPFVLHFFVGRECWEALLVFFR